MNVECWEGVAVVRMVPVRMGGPRRKGPRGGACSILYRALRDGENRLVWMVAGPRTPVREALGALLADAVLLADAYKAIILPGFGGLHEVPVGALDELPYEPVPEGMT